MKSQIEPSKNNELFRKNHIYLSPFRSTLLIIGIYGIFGLAWILFSDMLLEELIEDPALFADFQSIKGFLFVIGTAVLFYFLIKRRMDSYYRLISDLEKTIFELESSNNQLVGLQDRLYHLAYYDTLTGLLSKTRIIEQIKKHIEENPDELFGLVYIDIDDFKHINEMKGHNIGDELIRLIANDLDAIARPLHEVSRLGGDEFLIFVKNVKNVGELLSVIQEGVSHIPSEFTLEGETFFVTFSAGVSIYPLDGKNYDELMINADLALHMAKVQGKDQIIVYQQGFRDQVMHHIALSNMLHQAILNQELMVYYQPLYAFSQKEAAFCEALIRWNDPKEGFIPPLDFIKVAEETGQINAITYFVLDQAIQMVQALKQEGYDIVISINLSAKMLNDEFILEVQKRLTPEEPLFTNLILEITESVVLEHIEESIVRLKALKTLGFKIALDDFGTGYSSLTYLQRLPIDILKIDQSFIRDVHHHSDSSFMKFFIELAHNLHLFIVFEGIEEEAQKELLLTFGADGFQGYLYAKPMPTQKLINFYQEQEKK